MLTLPTLFGLESETHHESKNESVILEDYGNVEIRFTKDDIIKASNHVNAILNLEFSHILSCRNEERLNAQKTVAICMPNSAEFLVTFLGVVMSGSRVCAPTSPLLTEKEMDFEFRDLNVSLVLMLETDPIATATAAAKNLDIPVGLVRINSADDVVIKGGRVDLNPDKAAQWAQVLESDNCLLIHTSGTTKAPKIVPIHHKNLVCSIMNIIRTYTFRPEDTGLLVMPLIHVHGLICGMLAPIAANSKVVVAKRGFHSSTFLDDLKKSGVTWVTAVPSMLQMLVNMHKPEEFASLNLRFIRTASSALPPSLVDTVNQLIPSVPILEAYAMTEHAHQMTSNLAQTVGTVGVPIGSEIAICQKSGNPKYKYRCLPLNEPGEIFVRSWSTAVKYLPGYGSNQDDDSGREENFILQADMEFEEAFDRVPAYCSYASSVVDPHLIDTAILSNKIADFNQSNFPIVGALLRDPTLTIVPPHTKWLKTGDTGKMDADGNVVLLSRTKCIIIRGGENILPNEIINACLENPAVSECAVYGVPDTILGEVPHMAVVPKDKDVAKRAEIKESIIAGLKERIARHKIPTKFMFVDEMPKLPSGKLDLSHLGQIETQNPDACM